MCARMNIYIHMHRCNKNDTCSEWVKEYVRCNSSTRISLYTKYLCFLLQQQSAVAAAGGGGREDLEWQKRLSEMQQELEDNRTELEKTREDAQRSQVEMERLLQLVQMSQEEQNTKEKMIRDLQE